MTLPACIVHYSEATLSRHSDAMSWIPAQGAYDNIGEAYSFIMKCSEHNGYTVAGLSRESYIDGIWNKESVDEWLTEIQPPVE